MDKISETKREIRLTEWQRQYEEYQKSGQTVQKWCSENNVNIKTFYYRLRKIREKALEKAENHEIVPITSKMPIVHNRHLLITAGRITIEIPESASVETIRAVLEGLGKC